MRIRLYSQFYDKFPEEKVMDNSKFKYNFKGGNKFRKTVFIRKISNICRYYIQTAILKYTRSAWTDDIYYGFNINFLSMLFYAGL